MAKTLAMTSASAIRLQIESRLASKIPSALTPRRRTVRPVIATGIEPLDSALQGGLPIGALTEFVGPECSGRTAVALSYLAQITRSAKFCTWIDVSDTLDPESAAAIGVQLERLLWVRCGSSTAVTSKYRNFTLSDKYFIPPPVKRGLHGGGFGAHPRSEVKGLSNAIRDLLKSGPATTLKTKPLIFHERSSANISKHDNHTPCPAKPWPRIEQALRATDLLLQAGGFSAIVLDMGSLSPEVVSRIPLATWFRYRIAAERTQSSILLLTQYGCAKSSVELLLQFRAADPLSDEATVFTGISPSVEVMRHRFKENANDGVLPLRKSPHSTTLTSWHSRTSWTTCR
jgi:hypothetical protein